MSQYQSLFSYSGVEMKFTGMAIDEVCRKAEQKGGGARGLRGIMVRTALILAFCAHRRVGNCIARCDV